eukprot:GFYU01024276.1.p2 GENE.GFYU01024276.1~~GFYU01024276.1.p2  ORF type:complete len:198 (+),score=71.92 GFYU01024276.1:68-595(+)
MCKTNDKHRLLREALDLTPAPIIVFVNTKKTADILSRQLERDQYKAVAIHGGKVQDQRETAIEGIKNGKFDILVATGVAARGIDISNVSQVINYEMPNNIQEYTHRIGRTGRAGKQGLATGLLTMEDSDIFFDLKQLLAASNNTIPPELANHEAAMHKPGTDAKLRREQAKFAKG